jgi:hypothetical protein
VPIAAISTKEKANEIHPNLRAVHPSTIPITLRNSYRKLCADHQLFQLGVGVEKVIAARLAKTKLRYDALQTTFPIFKAFSIPSMLADWQETGVSQQPQAFTLTIVPETTPGEKLYERPIAK